MAKKFPLTEKLWLDWLEDCQKFADNDEDHAKLEQLFERATCDYICPEIWLEYVQYSLRHVAKADGIQKIRGVIERGLSAAGLHVTKGSALWEAYREVENVILMTMQPPPGSITTAEQNDSIRQQMERVGTIFTRQLALPLLDMESTMSEFMEWRTTCEDGEISDRIKQSYEHAVKYLDELKKFEILLEQSECPGYDEVYKAYILHEIKSNDPVRVQCIYERAIADNCLNGTLWDDYLKYMVKTFKKGWIVTSVYLRATRNCPWQAKFWQDYLIALERDNEGHKKMNDVFNEAMSVGFGNKTSYSDLWKCWCDIIRRRFAACTDEEMKKEVGQLMRQTFDKGTNHMLEVVYPAFGASADDDFTLWSYWASCEAGCLSDMARARCVYDDLISKLPSCRLNLAFWMEYHILERVHGDISHQRLVLQQAVKWSAADDGQAARACAHLTRFEREYGTLDQLDDARRRCEARLSKVAKRQEKQIISAQQHQQRPKGRKPKGGKFEKKKEENNKRSYIAQQEKTEPTTSKRAKITAENFKTPAVPHPRFVKPSSGTSKGRQSNNVVISPPPGYIPDKMKESTEKLDANQKRVETSEAKPCTVTVEPETEQASPSSVQVEDESRSVFLSNIAYNIVNLEEKIKLMFSSCGEVSSVRVVRTHDGRFRGFAHVTFTSQECVEKALALDRTLLEKRPLFVSPSASTTEKRSEFQAFKYKTGMEKHKLFVSSLNVNTSENRLREIFSAFGELKSLRIATTRAGVSKGIAYVEFAREQDASQAILKCDESNVDGARIQVAISNPPARQRQQQQQQLRGVVRTQKRRFNMTPRNQLVSAARKSDVGDSGEPTAAPKKMSNAQFAALFKK